MSFRNRCRIAGAEGAIDLSIPLVQGRDQKTLMKDVRISDRQAWQAQHWKTMVSCYSRSPWFEFYRDELGEIYKKRVDFLLDWNLICFEWSLKVLGLTIPVTLTDRYRKTYEAGEAEDFPEAVDARGSILPKNGTVILSGGVGAVAGVNAGSEGGAGAAALDCPVIKYRQVFEERIGFIPHLSILDLLFCEGRTAIRYIRS